MAVKRYRLFAVGVDEVYNMWQPWVQNYHGETNTAQPAIAGYARVYIWVDEVLKKSLGY